MNVAHFTIVCFVTWPLNDSVVGNEIDLVQAHCFSHVSEVTVQRHQRYTYMGGAKRKLYQEEFTYSLTCIHRSAYQAHNCKTVPNIHKIFALNYQIANAEDGNVARNEQ